MRVGDDKNEAGPKIKNFPNSPKAQNKGEFEAPQPEKPKNS